MVWNDVKVTDEVVQAPDIGGIYKDSNNKLIPFVGTVPAMALNIFSWNTHFSHWECFNYKPDLQNNKGPIHPGQFCHQEQKYHDCTKELHTK